MNRRYLRKVDGSYVCRDDNQPVMSRGAHEAQWHSLSPKPARDALSGDSMALPVEFQMIGRAHNMARGPWDAE